MLEAVFFDFGDTLVNSSKTLLQVHQEFTWPTFKELGAKVSYDEFKQALTRTINSRDPPIKPVKLHNFHVELAKELGLKKFTEEEALSIDTEVWRRHLSIVKLFPHARETLEWLQEKNLKVTLISNVFDEMLKTGKQPEAIVQEKDLGQVSDTGAVEAVVDEVLGANPNEVEAYRGGKDKLLGFFVGQVMKKMKGKANPQVVNELIKSKLSG